MHNVYFIKSTIKDNWIYVGSTSNLERRLEQHNKGEVKSTKGYRPFILIYTETFLSINEARRREKEIKMKRIEKERIIKLL
jgi:putative endonuclease